MRCLRCGNEDPKFFAYDQGVWYCRRCVRFNRLDVGAVVSPPVLSRRTIHEKPELAFGLTSAQKAASAQALRYLQAKKDVFLYAATGAGKTELCYESICAYLSQGKKVGFAIARRQVVLEIAARLRQVFPRLRIVEVCQGHTTQLDGDLIVCTIHQLYRYPQTFDLLILDELDAFPYAGSDLLRAFVDQACAGEKLCLSATMDPGLEEDIRQKRVEIVTLFERPHGKPLVVPDVWRVPLWLQWILTIGYCGRFTREGKQTLVFVPRKKDARIMAMVLRGYGARYIHAACNDKDEVMEAFRQRKFSVLVTTTLLERGITIPGVQVLVFHGDHPVFNAASLIQIFGRVGRKFDDPYGKGVCLCARTNEAIRSCVSTIEWMNRCARSALSPNE
ncbi:helicase-related protein [uncultured Dubosiella sp.]|uniref:helicase-related protein n=1 Tax=uncultured Dubosiella sp. TaxID=1937011 RepID=UPI00258901D9|nr:helicase-related protein [uncultured Dubosiella sp.]